MASRTYPIVCPEVQAVAGVPAVFFGFVEVLNLRGTGRAVNRGKSFLYPILYLTFYYLVSDCWEPALLAAAFLGIFQPVPEQRKEHLVSI